MPLIHRSPRLSSVLTAANAAISSIYSVSTPVTTSSPIETSVTVPQSSVITTFEPSVGSTSLSVTTTAPDILTSDSSVASTFLSVTTTSSNASIPTSSVAESATSLAAGSPKVLSKVTTGKTTYAGVNLPGLDFSCDKNGACKVNGVAVPDDAAAQMQHFTSNDNLNIFRLTVGWQYLTNNVVGGALDAENFATYDKIMQSCLSTGAKCVVDVHNYARWNGGIIGQGGPTNAQFAALWTSLADKYSSDTNVIFGIMNEPHDLDVSTWAETVQEAVTAIRNVAPNHMILIPGSSYSAAGRLPTEAGFELLKVTNPDGSTTNIHFDVHMYLDADNSGSSPECVTDGTAKGSEPLATWLRDNGRMAMVTETGGGNTDSCEKYVCEELAYLNQNSDVFLGYIAWAAGAFSPSYALSLTPTGNSVANFQDKSLMTKCFSRA